MTHYYTIITLMYIIFIMTLLLPKKIVLMYGPVVFATVVPDEDGQRSADDEGQVPVPSGTS